MPLIAVNISVQSAITFQVDPALFREPDVLIRHTLFKQGLPLYLNGAEDWGTIKTPRSAKSLAKSMVMYSKSLPVYRGERPECLIRPKGGLAIAQSKPLRVSGR